MGVKVKLLNATHPSHDPARLDRLRALLDGGAGFHRIKRGLFPKRPVESEDLYKERMALTRYVNHAGAIVSVLGALLFAEAPKLTGLDGDYWQGLWGDCDGQGTSWRQFWRLRFRDAQAGRHAWVWVNLPARDPEQAVNNRAEEEKAGLLDAYLVALTPEQVIDWETDDRGRLAWILFRSIERKRARPTESRKTVWKWTYLDATVIQQWTWTPQPGEEQPDEEAVAEALPPVEHNLGALPVIRLTLPADLWAMGKLEDPAIAAAQARGELTWALHQAASELLTITSKWGDSEIALGHGACLRLQRDKDGEDKASYVGPSGVALDHLAKDVEASRDEVYRIVQQMALSADADAARQRLSGESKAQDWKATEIVLSSYAELVRDAMQTTLRFIATRIRGEDDTNLSVAGLDGWSEEDLLTFLEAAALSVDAARLSPTFKRVVAKRQAQRLLQDETDAATLATIEGEIDDADLDALDPMSLYPPPPPAPAPAPASGT